MKNVFLSLLVLPGLLFGMHHEKNPIIFYLDLEIAEGNQMVLKNLLIIWLLL